MKRCVNRTCRVCHAPLGNVGPVKLYCDACRIEKQREAARLCQRRMRATANATKPPRKCITCGVDLGTTDARRMFCPEHAAEQKRLLNREHSRERYVKGGRTKQIHRSSMPKAVVRQGIDLLEHAPQSAAELGPWLGKLDDARFAAVLSASVIQSFDTLTPRALAGILVQCRERIRGTFVSVAQDGPTDATDGVSGDNDAP